MTPHATSPMGSGAPTPCRCARQRLSVSSPTEVQCRGTPPIWGAHPRKFDELSIVCVLMLL